MLCIPHQFVEFLSTIHTIFWKDDDIQNLRVRSNLRKVCLTCVSMPSTKFKERVNNVHEVNNNKTQLLLMLHNQVRHNHTFCTIKYQNYH
jgi:hypothetical protein